MGYFVTEAQTDQDGLQYFLKTCRLLVTFTCRARGGHHHGSPGQWQWPPGYFPAVVLLPGSSRLQPETTSTRWHQIFTCSNHFCGFPPSLKQKPNSSPCPTKPEVWSARTPSSSCLYSSRMACPLSPAPPSPTGHLDTPGTLPQAFTWKVLLQQGPSSPSLSQTCGQLSHCERESTSSLPSLVPSVLKISNIFSVIFTFTFYAYHQQIYFVLIHLLTVYLPPPANTRIWAYSIQESGLFTAFPGLKKKKKCLKPNQYSTRTGLVHEYMSE